MIFACYSSHLFANLFVEDLKDLNLTKNEYEKLNPLSGRKIERVKPGSHESKRQKQNQPARVILAKTYCPFERSTLSEKPIPQNTM